MCSHASGVSPVARAASRIVMPRPRGERAAHRGGELDDARSAEHGDERDREDDHRHERRAREDEQRDEREERRRGANVILDVELRLGATLV